MLRGISKKNYLFLFFIFLVFFGLYFFGALKPLSTLVHAITLPVLKSTRGFSVKIGENFRFFKDRETFLSAYNECVLGEQNAEQAQANFKMVQNENDELRKLLDFKRKNTSVLVLAEVVGKAAGNNDQIFIINRGKRDGLENNFPVIVGRGILVGKITKVDEDISMVRLINDNQSKVAATLMNSDKSLGVVEGGYGISLKMNLIPRDENVQIQDQVLTSGLETGFPRGLLIGSVASIENEPHKPFQQAILNPAVDLSKLTIVSVLVPTP